MHFKLTSSRVSTKMNRPSHKGYNKHCPDVTVSRAGIEYDMSIAPIKAYYYGERLAEVKNKHESLAHYATELARDANYVPKEGRNIPLEHARSVKIQRHRDLLPQLLF